MDRKLHDKTWQVRKDDHKTEGYNLKDIFEIDLPFWQCKQNLYVEKDVEIDRFSFIILELVNSGKNKYSEIYDFLGIDEDSFVNILYCIVYIFFGGTYSAHHVTLIHILSFYIII